MRTGSDYGVTTTAPDIGEATKIYASKVTIIHRRKEFRAQPILLDEARSPPGRNDLHASTVRRDVHLRTREETQRVADGLGQHDPACLIHDSFHGNTIPVRSH